MITQTELNTIIERANILADLYELADKTLIIVDIQDFFYKIKSLDYLESLSFPTDMGVCPYQNLIHIEWIAISSDFKTNELKIEFKGNQKVNLFADYESFNLTIDQEVPLNDDFPNIIVSHLQNFKQTTKKKKYK